MHVNDDECHAAGLDPAEVARIARGLSRYGREAQRLGLTIFGGSAGSLRFDDGGDGALVLADLDGYYDGGDGAYRKDAAGLYRGENE
ncbi:hypothetical protein [Pseudomonas nitroreducens]|uniref:hypothetical protein n=1 Tax=Pseudomonas nitroreducens TaxID=46680 RepID=UPI002659240D|nr:hypothetical protein [Pseudomonas nitroreducens]MCP1652718.1 hypothetical protein [Pseudomonas nitroreducens]